MSETQQQREGRMLQFVEQVNRENPHLLQMNIGATCFEHTTKVRNLLRANGYRASLMLKIRGEGQYTPPGFKEFQFVGTDGRTYTATGYSHDAIYVNGTQVDTLGGANEHPNKIYESQRNPDGWSFDPTDGPQIIARPRYAEIPANLYRAWNVAEDDGAAAPGAPPVQPPPPPRAVGLPSYNSMGDDLFFVTVVGRMVEEEMADAGGMNAGSASWIARAVHGLMERFIQHGDHRDKAVIVNKVRNELRAVLGRPPIS